MRLLFYTAAMSAPMLGVVAINDGSVISIGLAITVAVGAWKLSGTLAAIDARLRSVERWQSSRSCARPGTICPECHE